jgi:hypothetical protein
MNEQKDSRNWVTAPMARLSRLWSIWRKFGRYAVDDIGVCKTLPNWDRNLANPQIIFAELQKSDWWVTICAKSLQKCRFDPYVGNGLLNLQSSKKPSVFRWSRLRIGSETRQGWLCQRRMLVVRPNFHSYPRRRRLVGCIGYTSLSNVAYLRGTNLWLRYAMKNRYNSDKFEQG